MCDVPVSGSGLRGGWFLLLIVDVAVLIRMGGLAGSVSGPHVHGSCVFTGPGSICGYTTGPTFTVTGCGPIGVLQGLVFDVWIGGGGEAPDVGDLFGHDEERRKQED